MRSALMPAFRQASTLPVHNERCVAWAEYGDVATATPALPWRRPSTDQTTLRKQHAGPKDDRTAASTLPKSRRPGAEDRCDGMDQRYARHRSRRPGQSLGIGDRPPMVPALFGRVPFSWLLLALGVVPLHRGPFNRHGGSLRSDRGQVCVGQLVVIMCDQWAWMISEPSSVRW